MKPFCLYIDKENVKSIVKSGKTENIDKYIRLIKENIDVYYNFPKNEIKDDNEIRLWFQKIAGDGVNNNSVFADSNSFDQVHQEKWSGKIDNIFGVYLLNDKPAYNTIAKKNCILIGTVGQELHVFQQLKGIENEHIDFLKDLNWNDFCPKLPLTDILLCDNYYFANENVYKKNKNDLLRILSSIPRNHPVNVVIITRNEEIDSRIKIEDEVENIKDMVIDACDNEDSTVTIVGVHDLHDRYLITNYYYIHATAGFQKQKNIKCDVSVSIKGYVKKEWYNFSMKLLHVYQSSIKNCKFCIGDKKSNLIRFNW